MFLKIKLFQSNPTAAARMSEQSFAQTAQG
jgi:hypothetical protein